MRNSPKRQNILARMKENIYRNFGPAIDKFLVVEKLRQLVRLYVLLVSKRSLVTSRSLQTLKVGLQLLDVKYKRKHSSFYLCLGQWQYSLKGKLTITCYKRRGQHLVAASSFQV